MFGLTPLGIVPALISLVAVAAGVPCLVRDRGNTPGRGPAWRTSSRRC